MTRIWLAACTAIALAAGCASTAAQDTASQPGVATIQAHARAVVLDVIVRDNHGHPIHGLKAEDFVVAEDGAPQRIAHFDEAQFGVAAVRPTAKLPVNTFSNQNKVQETGTATVLLLDALDTAAEWQMYARDQVLRWVNSTTLAGPTAMFSLDRNGVLHQIQGFTTDVEVLKTAVKERAQILVGGGSQGHGYIATTNRLGDLTGAMQALGQYLSTFPGRKNLIWFTGSVPVRSYDGGGTPIGGSLGDRESFIYDFATTTDELRLGRVSVYPIDAEGLRTDPAFDASRTKAPTNAQIMAFGVHQGDKHEDLEDVAEATGGKAFYNTNDLKGAVDEVVESGSDYYTLTYYPTNKNWDGKYRKLKVALDQEGAHLEYRRGYYALKESGTPKTQRAQATNANTLNMRRQITNHPAQGFWQSMHLGALDPGSIVFRVQLQPAATIQKIPKGAPMPEDNFLDPKFRDKPFRDYDVNFVADGRQLQISPAADGTLDGEVEFVVVVTDDKGDLVNMIDAKVAMNLKPATYEYLLRNGVQFPARIAVPAKGNYFIRAGVHDVPSGKSGALEINVGEIKMDAPKP